MPELHNQHCAGLILAIGDSQRCDRRLTGRQQASAKQLLRDPRPRHRDAIIDCIAVARNSQRLANRGLSLTEIRHSFSLLMSEKKD